MTCKVSARHSPLPVLHRSLALRCPEHRYQPCLFAHNFSSADTNRPAHLGPRANPSPVPQRHGLCVCTHLRQRHPVDDEVRLLGALPCEGMMVDVVGAGIPVVLALHIEEGAFGAAAAQRQGLLVVVEVV